MQASIRIKLLVASRYFFLAASTAYTVALITMARSGAWFRDSAGHFLPIDFVDIYAAGRLALNGKATGVYNWTVHGVAEAAALNRPIEHFPYFGWHYPPPFLLVAACLALLPYAAAFSAWIAGTLVGYAIVISKIANCKSAWLGALAFPATFYCIAGGQTGFFSATLVGLSLVTLEISPIVSGMILGLMSYKPQFVAVFPFALLASRRWSTLLAVLITAIGIALISMVLFGIDAWIAFVHSLPVSTEVLLVRGTEGFEKLDSVFGVTRWAGLGLWPAVVAQALASIAAVMSPIIVWRSPASQNLKAATLVAASLVFTPYVYVYELPILVVAIAFLVRDAMPDETEFAGLCLAFLAALAGPLFSAPVGFLSIVIVSLLIARRARREKLSWPAGAQYDSFAAHAN